VPELDRYDAELRSRPDPVGSRGGFRGRGLGVLAFAVSEEARVDPGLLMFYVNSSSEKPLAVPARDVERVGDQR
jgi:hypothetical protein